MTYQRAAIIILAAVGTVSIGAYGQAARSVWDGVYTADQAAKGQPAYSQYCAACHGETLAGGESAPPLAGGEFLSNWNGLTLGDLFERIRTSMPQDKPGSLSREVNSQILAYILKVNQFPGGKADLPQQTEALKGIQIVAQKPAQ